MFLSPSFENPTLGGYLSLLEMLRKQAKINEHINVGIILVNFKKAGVESFSIALGFQIELNRTYFRIDWLGQQVKGLYGQNVESSIIMVANGLAKSLFDQIQERRLKGVSNSGMIQ